MHQHLAAALEQQYANVKLQYPEEGRRKRILHVLAHLWGPLKLAATPPSESLHGPSSTSTTIQDFDPMDHLLDDEELGVVIRTDYSNEDAWNNFVKKLRQSEVEFVESTQEPEADTEGTDKAATSSDNMAIDPPSADSDDSSDEMSIIKIIDPTTPEDRGLLHDISNLTALRLLNDVDIRPSPDRPPGTKPISPPNPLVDQGGWQEIYFGKNIWIYDSRSNLDECVRVISQVGDIYGTATGDSWRARVTHICELQFNMSYLGMKVDFGGLDRWDYGERQRNLKEAAIV
ncbi:uncharacterized protein LACBIDRAFT_296461 [Laccaria bicolor S238N-H82]|uniref:Predicted protein n=1 Tax=Laccaria bicolor (strain S238N-H82 / ATCC MYA-4686) TaxID=486041 RepID=B0D8V5_LACBS|nr:uncharacterized protein LACBIDRAFT_296461 [Laccaria bicolor S238N-H82]EDR09138.1 predicted protein [Laccaria bicolor S238N-H82]|eukprot:XP_001880451.1 predicted protein [Laccaria bicolor S238N-H82]